MADNNNNTNSSESLATPHVLHGKYELGRVLGQGTFAKVFHAKNLLNGQSVAMKVVSKDMVEKVGMTEQIKREISVMKKVKHPNIVNLHEVMASKSKIYFAMEYVRGGELFAKVEQGRLTESAARSYFRQLISAVDFCHSRGVYHRDLKPENLLLDDDTGNLKVSDFGLSALSEHNRKDGLLHTTCGTPAYVAPEVIGKKGYDGAKADLWSCGVILYVLLAGYLPFHDDNIMVMYRKIYKGDYKFPLWFSPESRRIVTKLLDPDPKTRITITKLMDTAWFKKQSPPDSVLKQSILETEQKQNNLETETINAFHIISLSRGFDLSPLFEDQRRRRERSTEVRFATSRPASSVIMRLEEAAKAARLSVKTSETRVKMEGRESGRKGKLEIAAEMFMVTPAFMVVEVRKDGGDTLEYNRFCSDELRPALKDIVWTTATGKSTVG